MSNETNNVDESDLGLFIGTRQSYTKFKQKHQIADSEDDKEENSSTSAQNSDKTVSNNKTVLSKDTLTTISEETLTILRRTRTAHDYDDVYMQSSLEFYDKYYNDTDVSPELKAARQIRRVYRSYMEYLNAVAVRNAYIDTLVDKYGEDDFMRKFSMGLVKDWIPPIPSLSKKSEDYEFYLSGMLPITAETLSEDAVLEILDSMVDDMEDVEMVKMNTVEDSIGIVKLFDEIVASEYSNGSRGTSISSLEDLNKVFKSWYKPSSDGETGKEIFKNAPENIRKRFLETCAYSEPGLLTRLMNGEEMKEPELNMKEMVRDSATGRSMTREELMKRQLIRFLAQNGWSESRLLNYANVGSSLERSSRRKKARRKRRGNQSETGGDLVSMYGMMNAPEGIDPMYVESNELVETLNQLMRGD